MHSHKKLLFLIVLILGTGSTISAWTGPTATAPGGNVSAPINVSSNQQVKDGVLGVGGLLVFGNALISGSSVSYLNFGAGTGSGGYGFRNNNGSMEFKNSSGSWTSFQSLANTPISTEHSHNGTSCYWTTGSCGANHFIKSVTVDAPSCGTTGCSDPENCAYSQGVSCSAGATNLYCCAF